MAKTEYTVLKRIIFTFLLALVTALAVHAQSLTGKQWCTVLNDEDGQGIAVALTFEKNGTCEMLIATQQDMKEDGVPINLLNDEDLNNQFNNGKAKVDVDYEIKGMDAKTKSLLNKQIKGELNTLRAEFKKALLGGMPKMDNLKIVKLESKQLVVKNSDNQEIPFYAE